MSIAILMGALMGSTMGTAMGISAANESEKYKNSLRNNKYVSIGTPSNRPCSADELVDKLTDFYSRTQVSTEDVCKLLSKVVSTPVV